MARTDPRPNYGVKRRVRADGYVDVWMPQHPLARADGYVFEHRMRAFDAGLLTENEPLIHIHHQNHVYGDNSIGNLKACGISEHGVLHANEGVIYNQYGAWKTGTGFQRRHAEWLAELGDRHCEVCGRDINGLRLDATVCGNTCRVKRWKRTHR